MMSKKAVSEKGCFSATYPNSEWVKKDCLPPPKDPNAPTLTVHPNVGYQSSNILAEVKSPSTEPKISIAKGYFDSVTPPTLTEMGPYKGTQNLADAFTIQLNSQFFPSPPACNNVAGCLGWEQFIYSKNQCSAGPCIFIEYWLIGYGPSCPTDIKWIHSGNNCFIDSSPQNATALSAAQLQGVLLTGDAINDMVMLTTAGKMDKANGLGDLVSLSNNWNTAEFGIFGDCCKNQASFSAGTKMTMRTQIINGNTNSPICGVGSFTAETNNLGFDSTTPALAGPGPAVIYTTSSAASGALPNCAIAQTIGDTHLTTFGGLLYDFQASGDFILAMTDSDFVVQTRQVPRRPTRPDVAVNKAVAIGTGKSRVAICLAPSSAEPTRVNIDGVPVILREGKPYQLPGGGDVVLKGDTYIVRGPHGDSVRAVENGDYIDVSVGLGHWPSKVRGLLANSSDGIDSIEARDGTELTAPFSYEELYGHFTKSWRVLSNESMLSPCGSDFERSVPKKLFFAKDLDPSLSKMTRNICKQAGIENKALLDACTLDVAVLKDSDAANVYKTMPNPLVVGDEK
ncbi:hypothetical protein OL229_04260 [Neisseriaceae bacterium JH1-16]|nr:hypothetical protein [Neisseriaceae bacterium JH1-16]